ncbi:unnamed protein product, partial [Litomosoides sigmodontis]
MLDVVMPSVSSLNFLSMLHEIVEYFFKGEVFEVKSGLAHGNRFPIIFVRRNFFDKMEICFDNLET